MYCKKLVVSTQELPSEVYSSQNEFIHPTLNGMGFSYQDLTNVGEAFIDWSENQKKPVLDIGAAYGFATHKALKRGASVIANDICRDHLEILAQRCPEDCSCRLTLSLGRFPNAVDLLEESLSGVFASNVFHFLSPPEVTVALKKIYGWLMPGGKIFVVVMTPYTGHSKDIIPLYEARKNHRRWPGIFKSSQFISKIPFKGVLPERIHLFDKKILEKVLLKSDFQVEHLEYIPRSKWPTEWQYDGKESLGFIGVKPF